MADQVQTYIKNRMPAWRKQYTGVEELTLAVMGCVVNGPGESKHANLGISLPGTGEDPKAPVYVDGKLAAILQGENLGAEFTSIVEEYVASHYSIKSGN
jgi:(E)-4-hydroxy-3-methylbut-2-enyl-diphosphate synthase